MSVSVGCFVVTHTIIYALNMGFSTIMRAVKQRLANRKITTNNDSE